MGRQLRRELALLASCSVRAPSQVTPNQWPEWLTTCLHAANVTATMQSRQWLRASRAVGSLAETRHKTQLTFGAFGLTLELRHAVLLESASVRPSRLWPLFPVVLPLNLKPITAVLPLCSLDCPHPRSCITAVAVTVSSTSSECPPCVQMQARRRGCHCLTTLSVFVRFQVPPAAVLPFDSAVCVNLPQRIA